MMTGAKRKASEFRDEQEDSERPSLPKRRTCPHGIPHPRENQNNDEDIDDIGFLPTVPMNTKCSPGVEDFQTKLTGFCERYGSTFGPAYIAELRQSHSEVISNTDSRTVMKAGQRFLEALNQYTQDLQQAAIQQIQLRAQMIRIGVGKETTTAMDVFLSQMDRRIVEISAESSVLWQEFSLLESPPEKRFDAASLQQSLFPPEIAAF
ncbi:uncharacterized protein RCC_06903 [Ramularia collo-cygni]|uniref:Uncharacterized protein n=1 Tax=Ramularia collo-cygni TaxID=112498 RepID=A0A2D3UTZ0_9PEZI|nr:uncharacterized protein RCC_06903 [Ramularia collo-cygni]CZT21042.1 uncharacterized protein RCC_06903 [Ramularia collo-cygni]